VVLLDLDGVLWLADEPIEGAAAAVRRLRDAGVRVGFATNNSSLTVGEYRSKLAAMGVDAEGDDLVTSAQAAAAVLAAVLPAASRVLCCAGDGVIEAVSTAGFTAVDDSPAAAVVVGWHRTFDFERLHRAARAVRAGARFVATNADPTYPGPDGLLPGNGALVAAVATAAEQQPEIAGKPFAPMAALVRARFGARGVMVGDRPTTDGRLAAALGWPFVLIASDVTATETGEGAPAFTGAHLADAVDAIAELVRGFDQRGPSEDQ